MSLRAGAALVLACALVWGGKAAAAEAPLKPGDVAVTAQGWLLGVGIGIDYALDGDTSAYAQSGVSSCIVCGVEHHTLGLREFVFGSLYLRGGAGYAESSGDHGLHWAGPALELGLGNEWRWQSGLVFGVEWFTAGIARLDDGQGFWGDLCTVRLGYAF